MRIITLVFLFVVSSFSQAGYPEGFQAFVEGDYQAWFKE
jgi:O-antigen/teichoic acid export membrane protein